MAGEATTAGAIAGTAITPGVGTIIGAGVGGVFDLLSGILDIYATKDVNKQNLRIYEQERKDKLAAQKTSEMLAKRTLALNERAQIEAEKEAAKNREERSEERGYGRMMSSYERGAALLSQGMGLLQAKTSPLIGRK